MPTIFRFSRRGTATGAALAALLSAAPALLFAQTSAPQPPMGGAMGQAPAGMGGRRGSAMQMLLEGISLTDAQRVKFDSLQTANRARMRAMREQMGGQMGGPPDSATRAQRRQEMEAQGDAMRAMLTPDQQKTFDANVARMRERMQQRMNGGGAGRR